MTRGRSKIPSTAPTAWEQSATWREISRQAITRYNKEVRPFRPRCEAVRRSDGGVCQNLAGANGRCRLHGGAVPSGKRWHRPTAAITPEKTARKLRDLAKRARRRAARLAAMSNEERAAHERWQRSHAPTSAADRAARRAERKQAKAARASWERHREATEPSPEVRELEETIAALRARYDALRAEATGADAPTPEWFREGVFE